MLVGEIRQFCELQNEGQSLMRAAMTQLKKKRLVSLDKSGNRQVSDWFIPSHGQKCI